MIVPEPTPKDLAPSLDDLYQFWSDDIAQGETPAAGRVLSMIRRCVAAERERDELRAEVERWASLARANGWESLK